MRTGGLRHRIAFSLCALALLWRCNATGPCFFLGDCNGHGDCQAATFTCSCWAGWGSPSDIATYKAPDCSKRTVFTIPFKYIVPVSRVPLRPPPMRPTELMVRFRALVHCRLLPFWKGVDRRSNRHTYCACTSRVL